MAVLTTIPDLTCPYPGLRPFGRDEAMVFFGRDQQVYELLRKLDRSRFLAVVGSSGCGKSSLVRAGLIPALESGLMSSAGARWSVATMRPGSQPLRNLAAALLADQVLGWGDSADDSALLQAALRRGPLGLVEALAGSLASGQGNLLLVVDQFEEIFRFRREGARDEANAFVALLLETARQKEFPVHVVLTMRSDYLGDCDVFQGLPEALNDSQFLTPRLTRDQRQEAIVMPARVSEGEVEPNLAVRLLNDTSTTQDQLPLMQHVLMRLWKRAGGLKSEDPNEGRGIILTLRDYLALGGLQGALGGHADDAHDRLDEENQRIAELLFRCLSERGPERRDTRRRPSWA
jgi:hypothetical protein